MMMLAAAFRGMMSTSEKNRRGKYVHIRNSHSRTAVEVNGLVTCILNRTYIFNESLVTIFFVKRAEIFRTLFFEGVRVPIIPWLIELVVAAAY